MAATSLNGPGPGAVLDRVRRHLVCLKMPRALEALDQTVGQLERATASRLHMAPKSRERLSGDSVGTSDGIAQVPADHGDSNALPRWARTRC